MVTERLLRSAPVAACAGYHATSSRVIHRVTMTSITTAARAGLTWLGVHDVVVGWMFGGVGFHASIKGAELSCELDYFI